MPLERDDVGHDDNMLDAVKTCRMVLENEAGKVMLFTV